MMHTLNRRAFVRTVGLFGAGMLTAGGTGAAAAGSRPNILFIMVDDLGKEWVSCCGASGIKTPNIDRLAAEGMRFENAYSMPQCTPTRVTLLTGRYPWRTGWVNHWDVPRWGVGYFDWRCEVTFARPLKQVGYATAAAGKWQINDFRLTPDAMAKHGFDDWCMWTGAETGVKASSERYWNAYINTRAGSKTYDGQFGPDVYCNFLVDFMRRHRDEPMMLYFPMALVHGPVATTPDERDASSGLSRHQAMVRYTDKLVGRLVAALEELKLRRKTIVIFTTDNGTSGHFTGTLAGRQVRGGKAKENEAGCCEPFIVSCPGTVPAGVTSEALVDFTDLLPTFCELAGAPLPQGVELDGVSFAPVMLGQAADSPRQWIMALGHGPGTLDADGIRGVADFATRVIRDKRFKVWVDNQRKIIRLHDLQADPGEEHNLVDSQIPAHQAALAKFRSVIETLPATDARPRYTPRPANAWDRKPSPARRRKRR